MLRFGLLVTALVGISHQESQSCYVCASESLSSRWQITGLPRMQDSLFVDCSGQNPGKLQVESCAGGCFTYMFEDPDIPPNQGGNVMLVVRGCHTAITTVVSNRTSSLGGGSYCEYDATHPMSNSKGEQVSVRALTEFCGSTNCNTRQSTSTNVFVDCNQQTVDTLLGGEVLSCYECTPRSGENCHDKERKCSSKKYCTKQTVQLGSGFQVVKSCSNINIIGQDNSCVSYDVVTNPGGVAVRNKYTQCYCRNKQFCNEASTSLSALATIAVSSWLLSWS
uniref:Protein sleepless n=1 Tax=Haemonchus contortus TaxID=6289 RepID=A0A7I4YN68_HAECO